MKIVPGEKFACYAYAGFAYDGLSGETQLGPRLWYAEGLGFEVAKYWQGWLGDIKTKEMKNIDFVLYTTLPSQTPKILDSENIAVVKTLDYVVYGLLLQGSPDFHHGFSLNGANVDGQIEVRQFSELKEFVPPEGLPVFRLGEPELKRAVALADRLKLVNEGGDAAWARVRRGISALWTATRLGGGDRLHQCVRALEALVKPDIGGTKKQFAHRIDQTFTLANAETRETLNQVFDVRSHVEHVHHVLDALDGDHQTRIDTANRRTRQVDILARFALARVLENAALFNAFKTDAGIDDFWKMDDAARIAMWGTRLNLTAVA